MRTISRTVIGFAFPIVCLVSTAALAQRTSYDYRRQADFTHLRTFAFKEAPPSNRISEKTTTYDSPFMRERINAAVAAQLEARGMTRNDRAPDVFVTTTRNFKTNYVTYASYAGYPFGWGYPYGAGFPYGWGYPYGWGGGWWDGSPSYTVEEIVGTLAVDLEDAETGQLVWRGVGSKHVHESSKPERRIKRVNEQVAEIFKNFPPPAGH